MLIKYLSNVNSSYKIYFNHTPVAGLPIPINDEIIRGKKYLCLKSIKGFIRKAVIKVLDYIFYASYSDD